MHRDSFRAALLNRTHFAARAVKTASEVVYNPLRSPQAGLLPSSMGKVRGQGRISNNVDPLVNVFGQIYLTVIYI